MALSVPIINGTKRRHRIVAGRIKDTSAVHSRLPHAVLRAALVILLVATPSLLLPLGGAESAPIVFLIAISAAFFTVIEYSAASPSIIEFRDAPPFNRLRFAALGVTIVTLSLIMRGDIVPTTLTQLLALVGHQVGATMDFPFSPVRLMLLMMPQGTSVEVMTDIRMAAGIAYLLSLLSIVAFVLLLRTKRWPHRSETFNVWTNLPMFDPTAGADVVKRLNRDSQVNLILGFLLPFMIPAIIKTMTLISGPINLNDPQTLIWMVTAWAFLPSGLLMRGVALSRVAQMIHYQRKQAYARAMAGGLQPA